jgi:hypothetical protein
MPAAMPDLVALGLAIVLDIGSRVVELVENAVWSGHRGLCRDGPDHTLDGRHSGKAKNTCQK